VDNLDLKGSWYFDVAEWGPIDTTVNYNELYFGDSIFYSQNETIGQGHERLYLVTEDSIYYGDNIDDLRPFYKIIKLTSDTLWLKANPKILNNRDTVFYVKFPDNEFGHYDLTWTSENTDSLREKVIIDYNRRMWKYHFFKSDDMRLYDSLENLGVWRWNMKTIKDGEQKEKEH